MRETREGGRAWEAGRERRERIQVTFQLHAAGAEVVKRCRQVAMKIQVPARVSQPLG